MPDTTVDRPEPARGELAQRTRSDHAVSTLGYYAPELAAATTLGGMGTLLWHPALAAVAAAGFAARVLAARLTHVLAARLTHDRANRDQPARQARQLAETDSSAGDTTTRRSRDAAGEEAAG